MNAPTIAPVVALAALRSSPDSLHVDPATPGLAGVLVLFSPPSERPTPLGMRTTFADALARSAPLIHDPDHAAHEAAYLASLPDVVTPVAALGLAVRKAVIAKRSRWVHNATRENASKWTYCDSHVGVDGGARITGDDDMCAEAFADGRLVVDAGVPSDIADTLRTEYAAARGVVEPTRVKAIVAAHLARHGGRVITDACYLIPGTTSATCGVLAGLVDLGGWAETVAVTDPARIARLTSPVSKSIEQQIADVVAEVEAFVAKAAAIAEPTSDGTLRTSTGEHIRETIAEARATASLWSDRLQLTTLLSLDVDAVLNTLDAKADAADAKALAAVEVRRKARAEDRKAAKGLAENLAALDDEQEREERAEANAKA